MICTIKLVFTTVSFQLKNEYRKCKSRQLVAFFELTKLAHIKARFSINVQLHCSLFVHTFFRAAPHSFYFLSQTPGSHMNIRNDQRQLHPCNHVMALLRHLWAKRCNQDVVLVSYKKNRFELSPVFQSLVLR